MYRDELELINYMFAMQEKIDVLLQENNLELSKKVQVVLKPLDDDGFPYGELTTSDNGTPYFEELERDF